MNIIDAMKSSLPFRSLASSSDLWLIYLNGEIRYEESRGLYVLKYRDLLDEYELKEPAVTITRSQLLEAVAGTFELGAPVITCDRRYNGGSRLSHWVVEAIATKLGLGVEQ